MPELPEVETMCRGLRTVVEKRRIDTIRLNRPDLRFPFAPDFTERLQGKRILTLRRRAKYMLATLDSSDILLIHLGMSGRFHMSGLSGTTQGIHRRHDHVVFVLDDATEVFFNDVRRFGFMKILTTGQCTALLDRLGPDADACTPSMLSAALARRSACIKSALLDQGNIAGLGNIYANEALFRAGISPYTEAGTLSATQIARLAGAIKDILREAIAAGGSSIRTYAASDGSLGYFQNSLSVYGRAGQTCPSCPARIMRRVMAGRSSFFCPSCQKAPVAKKHRQKERKQ